jgi:hypothetical protein
LTLTPAVLKDRIRFDPNNDRIGEVQVGLWSLCVRRIMNRKNRIGHHVIYPSALPSATNGDVNDLVDILSTVSFHVLRRWLQLSRWAIEILFGFLDER